MNDELPDNQPFHQSPPPETPAAGPEPAAEQLGAADIVEAFTALRHELKLQVRGGRDLQQSLSESLQRIEQRLAAQQVPGSSSIGTSEGRQPAEAVAETEESLQRVLASIAPASQVAEAAADRLLDQFDQAVMRAPWLAQKLAANVLRDLRGLVEQLTDQSEQLRESLNATRQGLELLHARVQRLMQQCDIQRVDVLHEPFDAETMHALDVIDTPSVPTSHVAQQLRPAYLWRGSVLRYADVRLAR